VFKIAIVGRPNVGKSSLFNRLVGKKKSIVADEPGVTRDRVESKAELLNLKFYLTDTGGVFGGEKEELSSDIKKQVDYAVSNADLILLVVDGKAGLMPADKVAASYVLKTGRPVIIVANKAEAGAMKNAVHEFYELGMEHLVAISTAHNLGMEELYEAISIFYTPSDEEDDKKKSVMISIIGRPNCGKSTLLNSIIGEERSITGDLAGLTRDSIDVNFEYKGQMLQLVDTAGIRRRKLIDNYLERLSVDDSYEAIRFSHVVILLVDAEIGLDKHEATLANKVIEEGRSLVIAINKWDLIENKNAYFNVVKRRIEEILPQISGVPVLYISAKDSQKLDKLLDACLDIYETWNKRVPTSKLNDWLKEMIDAHPLPLGSNGRRVRIKYITQYKTRPPTFKLFCNMPESVNEDYIRYLMNNLRKDFAMGGIPIRIYPAKTDNPYSKE
jgi:GTP-binding protein